MNGTTLLWLFKLEQKTEDIRVSILRLRLYQLLLRFRRPKAGNRTKQSASHPASGVSSSTRSDIPMVRGEAPTQPLTEKASHEEKGTCDSPA